MPKVNKLISSKKCQRCRHDKQKCVPERRQWPGRRCDRCIRYDYVCSANRTRSQEQSGGSGADSPVAQAPSSTLDSDKSAIELLQEKADLGHIENYCRELENHEIGKRARQRLTDVVGILRSRAQQFFLDRKFKDAEHIYTQIMIPPEMVRTWDIEEDRTNIVAIVVPLYEQMGNFAVAEAVQERLLLPDIEHSKCDIDRLTLNVKNLHHLYTLFYQRIRNILASYVDGEERAIELARSFVWYRTATLAGEYYCEFEDFYAFYRSIAEDRRIGIPKIALHIAAQVDNVCLTSLLLEKGECDINAKDVDGNTALHIAERKSHCRIVELLLEANADVTVVNDKGEIVLFNASKSQREGAGKIAKLMLEKGADANAADAEGRTPLHNAARYGALDTIIVYLSSCAEVDARDNKGITALMEAAERWVASSSPTGEAITRQLLQAGADVNASDHDGGTPLMIATRNGNPETVQLLIARGANVGALDCSGSTALHYAAESVLYRAEDVVSILVNAQIELEAKNDKGQSALSVAVRGGLNAVARQLLEHGANVETYIEGETLLFYALRWGREALVDLLLEYGADVNTRNGDDETPLTLAVRSGQILKVRSLIDRGADKEVRAPDGDTPLYTAVIEAVDGGEHMIVKTLIDRGADVESKSGSDQTPLQVAVAGAHGPVVKILLDGGAKVSASASTEPLLHCAIRKYSLSIIEMLLDADSKAVYELDPKGNTPIHQAVMEGDELYECILDLLLERSHHSNDIFTAMNEDGNTPLHLALLGKRCKMAKMLLAAQDIYHAADLLHLRNFAGFDIKWLARCVVPMVEDPEYRDWMEVTQMISQINRLERSDALDITSQTQRGLEFPAMLKSMEGLRE